MNWPKNPFTLTHAGHNTIASMEGIRGFAVFLVFLVHYTTLAKPWINQDSLTFTASKYLFCIGHTGVDLFFVLSGFLIYGMLIKKRKPFLTYAKRRIQRIYPTFTVVFIIYLLLSAVFPNESKIPHGLLPGAIYIAQNYLLIPGLFDIQPIITVAWSLSYEFFYYFITPLIIFCLNLRSWPSKLRITLFLLLSVLFFFYFSRYSGHVRLLMFVSGILLYETVSYHPPKKNFCFGIPALFLAIGWVAMVEYLNINDYWRYPIIFVFFYIFCLDCFSQPNFSARMFSLNPIRWLGNMSYSYYLLHGLALKFIFLIIKYAYPPLSQHTWLFWTFLPLSFCLTLIPTTLLFVFVEKPYSLNTK
ncbi:acyltransferase [Methylomonas sp. DH-1]|uniref:acyltransferase family protein n=1 Tax=Methylomonas sp. (strain DH-1) TaxID=1727196 RepID=UPI0007C913A0|nr:acyltransferase [Methylomonas sp. DH-1]